MDIVLAVSSSSFCCASFQYLGCIGCWWYTVWSIQ